MLQTFGSISRSSTIHPFSTAIAAIVGTVLWIAIATYASLPVSTTHAIVGSLIGVAIFNGGLTQVNRSVLTGKIAIPMLLSPILAFGLTIGLLKIWRAFAPDVVEDCICVEGTGRLRCAAIRSRDSTTCCCVSATCELRCSKSILGWPHHWTPSLDFERFCKLFAGAE